MLIKTDAKVILRVENPEGKEVKAEEVVLEAEQTLNKLLPFKLHDGLVHVGIRVHIERVTKVIK